MLVNLMRVFNHSGQPRPQGAFPWLFKPVKIALGTRWNSGLHEVNTQGKNPVFQYLSLSFLSIRLTSDISVILHSSCQFKVKAQGLASCFEYTVVENQTGRNYFAQSWLQILHQTIMRCKLKALYWLQPN